MRAEEDEEGGVFLCFYFLLLSTWQELQASSQANVVFLSEGEGNIHISPPHETRLLTRPPTRREAGTDFDTSILD